MKFLLTTVLLFIGIATIAAQSNKHPKWASKVKVITKDKTAIKGYLHSVTDSSITLTNTAHYDKFSGGNQETTVYLFSDLKKIRVNKKFGWLIGGAIGLGVTGIITTAALSTTPKTLTDAILVSMMISVSVLAIPIGMLAGSSMILRFGKSYEQKNKSFYSKLKRINKGAMFPSLVISSY